MTMIEPQIKQTIQEHQASAPIPLGRLAKSLGLEVKLSTLPAGISGEIRPSGSGYVIKVNRHDSAGRQRFTLAHEIGHYVLHRSEIGSGIADDALYRSKLSDAREAEANRFAAELLMPYALLQPQIAALGNIPLSEKAPQLASLFGVSETAMKIRLGLQ